MLEDEAKRFGTAGRRTAEMAADQKTTDESESIILPVVAGAAGLVLLVAVFAVGWMATDARARKRAREPESSVDLGTEMVFETEAASIDDMTVQTEGISIPLPDGSPTRPKILVDRALSHSAGMVIL